MQGFVTSQLYPTSFFNDLAQMTNRASDRLDRAKPDLLLPLEKSKICKSLDRYTSDERVAPFLHFFGLLSRLIVVAKNVFSLLWSLGTLSPVCWRTSSGTSAARKGTSPLTISFVQSWRTCLGISLPLSRNRARRGVTRGGPSTSICPIRRASSCAYHFPYHI